MLARKASTGRIRRTRSGATGRCRAPAWRWPWRWGDGWGWRCSCSRPFIAVWQLELTNYVEHYGLTRKHLGDGKYEHVLPRHSWNAAHKASNWLLINLQRHSDHHYKPDRRFPLLQTYTEADAPQLPYGYPVMTMAANDPADLETRHEPAGQGMARALLSRDRGLASLTTRRCFRSRGKTRAKAAAMMARWRFGMWQGRQGSNPRPADLESAALPTELPPLRPMRGIGGNCGLVQFRMRPSARPPLALPDDVTET